MVQSLTARDLERLQAHGVNAAEVERQLALFRSPPPPLRLARPCTVGDGIRRLDASECQEFLQAYETARGAGRIVKFVPASGAASRMFSSLFEVLDAAGPGPWDASALRPDAGPATADVQRFLDSLDRFAFRDALRSAFERRNLNLDTAAQRHDLRPIIETLLDEGGLNYGNQPKGLLAFHRYTDEVRTAFEEHLVEAAAYAASADGNCRLHFTVSPEHRAAFETLAAAVCPRYESRHGVRYHIGWSHQKPSTDTVAVAPEGELFRDAAGDVLLRPGGHGALLENLNDLQADIVLIKNIDNVVCDEHIADTVRWKKLLTGYLCALQASVFEHVRNLRAPEPAAEHVEAARRFLHDEFLLEVPESVRAGGPPAVAAALRALLERPIRVCGMVPNTGEPGGGPAWVLEPDGNVSPQIVERAQIDPNDAEQQRIFDSFTHFSPVDFACGVRDADGHPYDLRKFVDHNAVIFADKTSEGRALRALEHPGLWNGGMAHWLTVFVEVPLDTFNPVKTFLDWLRPAHQPGN